MGGEGMEGVVREGEREAKVPQLEKAEGVFVKEYDWRPAREVFGTLYTPCCNPYCTDTIVQWNSKGVQERYRNWEGRLHRCVDCAVTGDERKW
jgi:hypothetical protein